MSAISLVDSLAVRNRPKQFSDIVGNTANIKTIHGFLGNGQLPRTWLMSGDPGAGKTTLGRLLAMTVNCQNIGASIKEGKIEPCLKCTSCKLAMQNKHPDIFELNAGGEEGNVQSIRNLLDNMKLSPRFNIKCFILDECLPADTQVLLEDGTTVSLLEIYQNKDKTYNVLTFNTEKNIIEPTRNFSSSRIEIKVFNLPFSVFCCLLLVIKLFDIVFSDKVIDILF